MEVRQRASWQVDLKWVAGIFACIAIVISGVIFSLMEITERGRAEPLSAVFVGFVVDGRVSDEEFEAVQAQAEADASGFVSVSPLDIEVRGEEIAGLSKEETMLVFGEAMARVIYDDGSEAAEALLLEPLPNEDGEPQDPIELGPAGALNADRHSTFTKIFLVSLVAVFALLALVAFLSRGFGRLGAPAVVLALTSAPLAALWYIAGNAVRTPGDDEPLYGIVGRRVASDTFDDLRSFFLGVFLIALVWIGVAVVGTLLMPLARKIDRKLAIRVTPPWVNTPGPSA